MGLCSYCRCSHTRRLCAYSSCYIFSWWKRPRAPLGPPLGRLIYRRRFALLSAIPFRFSICRFCLAFRSASRLSFRSSSRFSSRSAFRFSSRSCVSPCVSPFVLSLRFASPMLARGRWHLVWAPFRLARRLFCRAVPLISFCFSISRLACRLVLRPVLRLVSCVSPCVPSCASRPASHPASHPASRFHYLSWGMIWHLVWAPFRPACRLPSCLACRSACLPCVSIRACRLASRRLVPLRSVLRAAIASRHCVSLFSLPVGGVFPAAPFLFARRPSYAVPCHVGPDDPDGLDETRRTTRRSSGTELMNDGTRR